MSLLFLLVVLILLFGGGGGYYSGWYGPYAYTNYGYGGFVPLLIVIVLIVFLMRGRI